MNGGQAGLRTLSRVGNGYMLIDVWKKEPRNGDTDVARRRLRRVVLESGMNSSAKTGKFASKRRGISAAGRQG